MTLCFTEISVPCSASSEKLPPADQDQYRIPQPDMIQSERRYWGSPSVSSLVSSENLIEEGEKRKSIFLFCFCFSIWRQGFSVPLRPVLELVSVDQAGLETHRNTTAFAS